jgi:hypothetical protein
LTSLTKGSIIHILSTNQGVHKLMATLEQLLEVISDPYNGREEGVDFWVDEDGYIQAQDVRTAALLMREANTSGQFTQNLVKVGQKGDSILLGFDTLLDVDAVYKTKIGLGNDILAEVKRDDHGKFCVYLNQKRSARMFNKLTSAKNFIKSLDKDLQLVSEPTSSYDDVDD